jgi:hypothetical protein
MASPNQAQKTPLAISLENAAQKKAQDALALLGKALPAQVVSIDGTGTIVTVQFLVNTSLFTLPNVQCALATSEYQRAPIQAGCKGVVFPADVYLGGVTGLGGGTADISLPGNLSALVFFPVGNQNFSTTDDPNAYVLYGPDGVIIRNTAKTAVLKVTTLLSEWTPAPGESIVLNGNVIIKGGLALQGSIKAVDGVSTYAEPIQTSGGMIAGFGTGDQVGLQSHTHTQAADSHGDTEQPTAAPTAGT